MHKLIIYADLLSVNCGMHELPEGEHSVRLYGQINHVLHRGDWTEFCTSLPSRLETGAARKDRTAFAYEFLHHVLDIELGIA